MAKLIASIGTIQFVDKDGKTVTTGLGNVSFVKDGSRNLAFYGSKGRSELKDVEFNAVFLALGLPVPTDTVAKDDDDDDDFVLPN